MYVNACNPWVGLPPVTLHILVHQDPKLLILAVVTRLVLVRLQPPETGN